MLSTKDTSKGVFVHTSYVVAFGPVKGLYLSQMLFHAKQHGGAFSVLVKDFAKQTGMKDFTQRACRKFFVDLGIIKAEKAGMPARWFYEIDKQVLENHLQDFAKDEISETINSRGDKSINSRGNETINSRGNESINSRGDKSINSRGNESINSRGNETINSRGNESINSRGNESINSRARESINSRGDDLLGLSSYIEINKNNKKEKEKEKKESSFSGTEKDTKKVGEAQTQIDYLVFMDCWNGNCGSLPKVQQINQARKTKLKSLVKEKGLKNTLELLGQATLEVSADKFWQDNRYGFDNILRHLDGKAEAWQNRNQQASQKQASQQQAPVKKKNFGLSLADALRSSSAKI